MAVPGYNTASEDFEVFLAPDPIDTALAPVVRRGARVSVNVAGADVTVNPAIAAPDITVQSAAPAITVQPSPVTISPTVRRSIPVNLPSVQAGTAPASFIVERELFRCQPGSTYAVGVTKIRIIAEPGDYPGDGIGFPEYGNLVGAYFSIWDGTQYQPDIYEVTTSKYAATTKSWGRIRYNYSFKHPDATYDYFQILELEFYPGLAHALVGQTTKQQADRNDRGGLQTGMTDNWEVGAGKVKFLGSLVVDLAQGP